MKFKSCEINSQLAKYIQSIFHYNDFVPSHSIERVVPTGNIFILVELDNFERKTYNNDLAPVSSYKKAWISGMQQKFINISAHQNSEMLVIQFKPYGLYPFLHKPVSQLLHKTVSQLLNNKVVATTDYFGNELIEAREEIIRFEEIKYNLSRKNTLLINHPLIKEG